MTDQEFREQHQPLHVPAAYSAASTPTDKVVFALADIGEGTADEIIRRLEALAPSAEHKPLIAATRQILSDLYDQGRISATDKEGTFSYHLHKITHTNDGAVNPELLAPGLD